jgi:hypothetical protein
VKAQQRLLFGPAKGQVNALGQGLGGEVDRLGPSENRLDDIGRQEGQRYEAAHIQPNRRSVNVKQQHAFAAHFLCS